MVASKNTIDRHVLVKVRQNLLSTRGVAPVAHQVANNSEERVHLDTSSRHLVVGRIADEFSGSAGSLNIGEDGVACSTEGQGEESSADVGGDTGEDDLLLARGFDSSTELRVIPGTKSVSRSSHHGGLVTHLTSPWRRMKGALGYISMNSLGRGPFGPVSAEVDRITGMSKT